MNSISLSPSIPFRKWLIVSQYYHPEPGAPQIRLRALAKELRRRGCEVEILTALPNYPVGKIHADYKGKFFDRETIDGVPVHRQWLYPAAGRRSLARLLCYGTFSLGAILRAPLMSKPDVVFIEAQPITVALAGLLCKLMRGVPFIYNTPDLQVEIAHEGAWLSMSSLVKAAGHLEGFLMKRAFCVSTVTDAFVEHFAAARDIPKSHITFLPNGADPEALRPLPAEVEYARELGVEGKTVFTYAGTHAPYHGLEIVIDAAERLRDRDDITFLMVGNGPIRSELEQLTRERNLTNVLFRESPFSEMARLMSFTRASIATVSNIPAAQKMRLSKVVPPLSCGVPVLYVGQGESARILEQNRCGLAVDRSADEVANAVRTLADSGESCREMGKRGRQLVEREFSWSAIVENWLAQLDCVSRGRDPWCMPVAEVAKTA